MGDHHIAMILASGFFSKDRVLATTAEKSDSAVIICLALVQTD